MLRGDYFGPEVLASVLCEDGVEVIHKHGGRVRVACCIVGAAEVLNSKCPPIYLFVS